MVTPAAKREAVAHLKGAHEMSERRACKVLACARMTVRYRSMRPDDHEEGLMVRRRGGRKRAFGTRAPMPVPALPNDRWSLDFVSDQFSVGRRFRILTTSTTAHENPWRSSPIHRSRGCGLRGS